MRISEAEAEAARREYLRQRAEQAETDSPERHGTRRQVCLTATEYQRWLLAFGRRYSFSEHARLLVMEQVSTAEHAQHQDGGSTGRRP